jgi:hypothetical protein
MGKPVSTHEDLSTHFEAKTSSNRSFGVVFAVVFALIALYPLRHGLPPRWWAAAVAAVFLLAGLFVPAVLGPLNALWTRLGLLLAKVVNPIVMAILFYGVVTPVGLLKRALSGDSIPRGKDQALSTYWIDRKPPGPAPESMADQF